MLILSMKKKKKKKKFTRGLYPSRLVKRTVLVWTYGPVRIVMLIQC